MSKNYYKDLDSLEKKVSIIPNDRSFLALLNIKNFKTLNSRFGFEIGDLLLNNIFERIEHIISNHKENIIYSKYYGTSYIFILNDTNKNEMELFFQHLLEALEAKYNITLNPINLDFEVGITKIKHKKIKENIKYAEVAIKKSQSYESIIYFDEKIEKEHIIENDILNDIDKAIKNKEIELYFQPKIKNDNSIDSAEILLRWNHPKHGFINTEKLIQIMEETGHIYNITEYVIHEGINYLKKFIEKGYFLEISINLSSKVIYDENFYKKIKKILEINKINPNLIQFEITESFLIQDENTKQCLKKLNNLGISIAIDDFGKGYSSFSYLSDLPIDTVKIDKSFIIDIDEKSEYKKIQLIKGIIELCHSLELIVIAEGVETKFQNILLKNNNIDKIQGYYYSRPLNYNDFVEFYKLNSV